MSAITMTAMMPTMIHVFVSGPVLVVVVLVLVDDETDVCTGAGFAGAAVAWSLAGESVAAKTYICPSFPHAAASAL